LAREQRALSTEVLGMRHETYGNKGPAVQADVVTANRWRLSQHPTSQ